MPTTTPPNSGRSSSSVRPELLWLHPDQMHPNSWNPNVVPQDILAKARESLALYGWLAPVVVRHVAGPVAGYEIVDGEHRWQIAHEAGIDPVPAFCIDGLSDVAAKKATVILNDLHGQARPDRLSQLFRDLLEDISLEELQVALPYGPEVLASLLPDIELPSITVGPLPAVTAPPGPRWVERTYRLPPEVAEILDDALAKARGDDEIEPWQALERVAADFLAG